jgi:hypothetical protein
MHRDTRLVNVRKRRRWDGAVFSFGVYQSVDRRCQIIGIPADAAAETRSGIAVQDD